jgi:hypothetical protein
MHRRNTRRKTMATKKTTKKNTSSKTTKKAAPAKKGATKKAPAAKKTTAKKPVAQSKKPAQKAPKKPAEKTKAVEEKETKVSSVDAVVTEEPKKKTYRKKGERDPRLPAAGTVLTREYKGQNVAVTVLDEGFEWGGKEYRSLSKIAGEVAGCSYNGFLFFNLIKRPARKVG